MKWLAQRLKQNKAFSASWNSIDQSEDALFGVGGVSTWSGANVSAQSAMRVGAVNACVRVISQALASVPWQLYERGPGNGKRERTIAINHPLYSLIHSSPNPEQTSFEFLELIAGHCALRGNAYAYIQPGALWPVALWPIHPDVITPRRDVKTNEVLYDVRLADGSLKTYPAYRILHLRLFSPDGLNGVGPLQMAAQQIGATAAADEYSARFWANDGTPRGLLTTPQTIGRTPEQGQTMKDNIRQRWREMTTGGNRHVVPVLDNDLKWQSIGINPEDAQVLETRNFNVSEIARIFGVPPHKIGQLDKATFSNIEHQAIEFVTDTIRPWAVRIEQSMTRALFMPSESARYFIEANLEGLLRGDIVSRYNAYKIAWERGWMSADEIRALENMNPQDGGVGAEYWIPVNMSPVKRALDGNAQAEPQKDIQDPAPFTRLNGIPMNGRNH